MKDRSAKRLKQWMDSLGDDLDEPGLTMLVWRCARAALAGGVVFQINEVLAAVDELNALDAIHQRKLREEAKAKAKAKRLN